MLFFCVKITFLLACWVHACIHLLCRVKKTLFSDVHMSVCTKTESYWLEIDITWYDHMLWWTLKKYNKNVLYLLFTLHYMTWTSKLCWGRLVAHRECPVDGQLVIIRMLHVALGWRSLHTSDMWHCVLLTAGPSTNSRRSICYKTCSCTGGCFCCQFNVHCKVSGDIENIACHIVLCSVPHKW